MPGSVNLVIVKANIYKIGMIICQLLNKYQQIIKLVPFYQIMYNLFC